MSRSTDPTIKNRLLEKCLDALINKGVSGFSLRKIADQADTSARMLIYHFGSADSLFAEVIIAYSRREKSRLRTAMAAQQEINSLEALIDFFWASYLTERRINVLRVFVEIYGKCLRDNAKYSAFFQEILHDWTGIVQQELEQRCGLQSIDSCTWATLIVAACRGLLMDLLASEETQRVEDAVTLFKKLGNMYSISTLNET